MVTTKISNLTAEVGAEIGQELGAQMISTYRQENPTDTLGYFIGRNILEQVLAQPGCVGIKFYNAYNEMGQKTLVYVGVNTSGNDMLTISSINVDGRLDSLNGVVADRVKILKPPPADPVIDPSWWDFE